MSRTLLIIDDNKSVRDTLRFLCERQGYRVLAAESGAEGLAIARAETVHGALVDVNMPGMNGLAVCRALKAMSAELGREMTVWIMTGARTLEVVKSAAEAGALAVFAKPFNFAELLRCLDEVLRPLEPSKPESGLPGHI